MSSSDVSHDNGMELFIQDYVSIASVSPNPFNIKCNDDDGCLTIVQYCEPLRRCIEWRQCDYQPSIRESDDPDWEIVWNGTATRTRSKSESSSGRKPPAIQFDISQLKSFQISKSKHQITFVQNDGTSSCKFNFQKGSVESLVGIMKSYMHTTQYDRGLYLVSDKTNLEQSYAQLPFPDDLPDTSKTTWQGFHGRSLEATMNVFSKVNWKYLVNGGEDSVVNERLRSSLLNEELPPREEFEVVAQTIPLPKRIPVPRISPLSPEQWSRCFDEDGVAKGDSIRELIFRGGVDPTIRKEVWMFLLGVYPWDSTAKDREKIKNTKTEEYFRMKTQWETISKEQEERFSDFKERKSLIEKDVSRTDRTMNFYAEEDNRNLEQLRDILMTYVMYNFDLGYVQGMSDILSPIFFLIQDEVESFWCFASAVEKMVSNFDIDQAGMKKQLQQLFQLLSTLEPDLAKYLQKEDSSNMYFCFRWLLVWFKREFSFDDIYILWETLWAQKEGINFHLLICVAILDTEKEKIMQNKFGFTEILKHINGLSNKIDLNVTLEKAEAMYQQIVTATDVPNATRIILGLPLEPEPEIVNGPLEITSKVQFSNANAVSYFSNEQDYENSINMHYM